MSKRALVAAGAACVGVIVALVAWSQRDPARSRPAEPALDAGPGVVDGVNRPSGITPTLPGSAAGAKPQQPVRAPGVSFAKPGSLAKIPPRYELTATGGYVAVDLAGGAASSHPFTTRPAGPRRTVHGRVVDLADHPVAEAIVLVAEHVWLAGGDIMAPGGAVTDRDGQFTIAEAPVATAYAVALHPSGWSDVTVVGDAPLVLRIRGRGELHGRATYNGHGESFQITLTTRPPGAFLLHYETDPDGRYTIASLPVGDYHASVGLAQTIAGGVSKQTERDITVVDGVKTEMNVEQVSATVVVATAKLPDGYTAKMVEYWMFPGADPPAVSAIRGRAKAEHPPGVLYGGHDAANPAQFHDITAGSYAICAIADRDALAGCSTIIVADGDSVRELPLTLVPP